MSWQLQVHIERQRDPILRYLRIARNDHLHGLSPILNRAKRGYAQKFESSQGKTYILRLTWDGGPDGYNADQEVELGDATDGSKKIGEPKRFVVNGLLPVVDQNGKIIQPPNDRAIPVELAEHGLLHLRKTIDDAARLKPSIEITRKG